MENKVFVWNNFDAAEPDEAESPADKREDEQEGGGAGVAGAEADKARRTCSKRVYCCPHCNFWASTASRFHVHIVGHFNTKPYTCSECGYQSNWRWDITKHIKMKATRDARHKNAEMIITDQSGEKNYDKYEKHVRYVQVEEAEVHKSEGKLRKRLDPSKKAEGLSPVESPQPPMVQIPLSSKQLPALPPLTRAPPRPREGSPTSQSVEPPAKKVKATTRLPPLMAFGNKSRPGAPAGVPGAADKSAGRKEQNGEGHYEIITPQGSLSTSLETLQRLASGSTQISSLKLPTDSQEAGENLPSQVSSESQDSRSPEEPQMTLDHQGNPEWKCNSCTFRDSEKETVIQHIRLAHTNGGLVSLVHAVHRCNVCNFAAGTKRHVQLHIDNSHGGQGSIISGSEGKNPDDLGDSNLEGRTFNCRLCPFKCTKQVDMRGHLSHHSPRPDCLFKCMFCPYYVASKSDLFEHLSDHGMEIPPEARSSSSLASVGLIEPATFTSDTDENGVRNFSCGICPFETRSRTKLVNHRQFHKPRGLPFKCPHCSYNVTRRHLMSQHVRMHGLSPATILAEEDARRAPSPPIVTSGTVTSQSDCIMRSDSPSPSLTITPVTTNSSSPLGLENTPNPDMMPILPDSATADLKDIPLVWVSRDGRYFKMFKCRHCPHVNLRKTNIQEHEKMHRGNDIAPGIGHRCPHCSYLCINAGVLTSHLKVHAGQIGTVHGLVDPSLSDEEQLQRLAGESGRPSSYQKGAGEEKVLYYCQHCPARFFFEKEIQIHSRFHATGVFAYHCDKCNYGARQQPHLLAHVKVHTKVYQERTQMLMTIHPFSSTHPPSKDITTPLLADDDQLYVTKGKVTFLQPENCSPARTPPSKTEPVPHPPPTSRFKCAKCPSSFGKLVTLQYHMSLHGADNPYKCHRCSYAAKTSEALQQHVALHADTDLQAAAEAAKATLKFRKALGSQSVDTVEVVRQGLISSQISPLKFKFCNAKGSRTGKVSRSSTTQDLLNELAQFKYHLEQEVPLSGVDLLKRKHQIEQNRLQREAKEESDTKQKKTQEDTSDGTFNYPPHIDRASGRAREKRFKCSKCPSAFEKLGHFKIHQTLHGAKSKYRCRMCDYSVKFFANFRMHIDRHKYHERVKAQKTGGTPLSDDSKLYEPIILEPSEIESEVNKENKCDKSSDSGLTTAERQHILLQSKMESNSADKKEEEREKKAYYCEHCPYASLRRDAVDSHSYRHRVNGSVGCYQCTFCDYTAQQPNFIKEHTKFHFRPFKFVQPEGYIRHEKQELWSLTISDVVDHEKMLVFAHDSGEFSPAFTSGLDKKPDGDVEGEGEDVDPTVDSGITVNFFSGDIVTAPSDLVISFKQNKGRSSCQSGSRRNSYSSSASKDGNGVMVDADVKPPLVAPVEGKSEVKEALTEPGLSSGDDGRGAQSHSDVSCGITEVLANADEAPDALNADSGVENAPEHSECLDDTVAASPAGVGEPAGFPGHVEYLPAESDVVMQESSSVVPEEEQAMDTGAEDPLFTGGACTNPFSVKCLKECVAEAPAQDGLGSNGYLNEFVNGALLPPSGLEEHEGDPAVTPKDDTTDPEGGSVQCNSFNGDGMNESDEERPVGDDEAADWTSAGMEVLGGAGGDDDSMGVDSSENGAAKEAMDCSPDSASVCEPQLGLDEDASSAGPQSDLKGDLVDLGREEMEEEEEEDERECGEGSPPTSCSGKLDGDEDGFAAESIGENGVCMFAEVNGRGGVDVSPLSSV